MRVLFITPALTPVSGWGRYTLDLIGALVAGTPAGVGSVEALLVTTTDSPGDSPRHRQGKGSRESAYPLLPSLTDGRRWVTPRALRAALAVRRLARSCDVVHCTVEPFAPAALLAGRPFVLTAHGTYLPRQVRRRGVGWLFARAARRAAAVICVSAYTEAQVRAAMPGVRTTVIHNGVHWQRLTALAENASPPETKRGPVILGVGQVKVRKGYHVVAAAMEIVRQQYPTAEYVIIGDATSEPGLASELRATPGVRALGRLDDEALRAWYHHADLFALPSINVGDKFEGFGLVYLEAGAAGLPAVAARGSGAEEAVLHEETGLLVPQNDPGATADAILRLLRDETLRARLGEGARRHAQAHGWDQVAAQVLAVYRQVLRDR